MASTAKVIEHLQQNHKLYVERLKEWVAIQSVSASPAQRPEVIRMVNFVKAEWDKLGAETTLKDIGMQKTPEGEIPLPPILLGKLGNDPKKKTICVYGHLDVQPAALSDGWNTEPFDLTIDAEGRMFGRGSSDDKGPVLGWLNVVEAFKACEVELPVNLKFIFEGMEESGSDGLQELVYDEKDKFLQGVDYVCISDNYWLGKNKPCLTYGLRGMAYFFVSVQCACKDLHSGVYGGAVSEAMTDLVNLMSSLVDNKGKILVPGIYDMVAPVSEDEKLVYPKLDFDPEHFKNEIGATKLIHDSKELLMMNRWRFPSLSLHGIEGAFADPGSKTVIPRKVTAKFSIRLVPNMDEEKVEKLVKTHLESVFAKLGSPNKLEIVLEHGVQAWLADFNDPQFKAGRIACKNVFGEEPDLTREGGSIPVTLFFQDALKKSVMLLPMGACDDSAHSQNEKLDQRNYFKGMELFAEYLTQVALIDA
ncbi:cytosolic non-specific dipeptidase-like [Symsagittifera roscoffensis]|uniref:cytosolic non-specific dipeptidase-like n=1 Tax=Symsagittifera roscoffensis TaxID=84072 RepID=UPI00307B83D7